MNQMEFHPRIVYIAGTGRSGSTLLDVFLSHHPAAVGTGELASFFLEWSRGGRCTCRELYPDCVFWSKVIEQLNDVVPTLTPLAAEQISRKIEAFALPRPVRARLHAADFAQYRDLWRTMMHAIATASGKEVIIDSSKSSRPVARRLWALQQLGEFELKIVHLVRDPRALMWSALRGSNRRLEAGKKETFRGGVYRALLGWSMTNALVDRATRATPLEQMVERIRYEDLTRDPIGSLRDLGHFLELDMEPVIDHVRRQLPFESGHGVGGNRMRRQGPIHIVPDEEWKKALPPYARLLASFSWPVARQYGYDVLPHFRHLQ